MDLTLYKVFLGNIKPLACEEMWEFDWQNDSFFQSLFSPLQTSHVIPFNVWLLHYNGSCTGEKGFESINKIQKSFVGIQIGNVKCVKKQK